MGTIKFWDGRDTPVMSGDCVVITGWDEELVPLIRDEIALDDIQIYLTGEVEPGARDIFIAYLAITRASVELDLCDLDPRVRNVVRDWERFCRCLTELDIDGAHEVKARIEKIGVGGIYLWRTRELLSLLLRIAKLLHMILCTPTPLGEISHKQRKTEWWTHDIGWFSELRALQSYVADLDFGQADELEQQIRRLLRVIDAVARTWHKENTGEAFKTISHMMLWSASYWQAKGMPTLAVLLVHRSLDFCITGHAWDVGLVYFDGERPRFSSQRGLNRHDKTDVGLMSVERELVQTGEWIKDIERFNILRSLNTTRNYIAFAHGPFRCSSAEADWFYEKARRIITDVGGQSRGVIQGPLEAWLSCIRKEVLFDFERSFHSNLRKIEI